MKNLKAIFLVMFLAAVISSVRSQPADCAILREIISNCSCEGAVENPNNIVINCRNKPLTSMPEINGTYNGTIYEFTLAGTQIQTLPDNAFQGLRIQRVDLLNTELNNISSTSFSGLESSLIVLKIGRRAAADMSPPFDAIAGLANLQELTLQNFKQPTGELGNNILPFINLQSLTLDNLGLTTVTRDAFLQLVNLKKLVLNNHPNLVTIPAGALNEHDMKDSLEELTITNTGITKLTSYVLAGLSVLKVLNLKTNQILLLEENCFSGLDDTLTTLDLSQNALSSQLSRIQPLSSLQVLTLQHIQLVSLATNSEFLRNKPNLRTLSLAYNVLNTIPSGSFINLPSLTTLDLSYNYITVLEETSLSNLTALQMLHLEHQNLAQTFLSLPDLNSLTSLTTLDLTNTPVNTSSWSKISQASSLETLKMSQTRQSSIPDFAFRSLTNLKNIYLVGNQIENLTQESLTGLRNSIKLLDLRQNNIKHFNKCVFFNFTTPFTVQLAGNPLQCDCNLKWLSMAVKIQGEITMGDYAECASPPVKANRYFEDLNPVEFVCSSAVSEPQCMDYYSTTTTTTTAATTSTLPKVTVSLTYVNATHNSIIVSWTIDLPQYLTSIVVRSTASNQQPQYSPPLTVANSAGYEVSTLESSTSYEICVQMNRVDGSTDLSDCINHRTLPDPFLTTTASPQPQMSPNTEVGIIIGAVVGGLILLAILVAIIYLMLIRKKSEKELSPVEARTFTRAAMPTVGYDSKRFMRKKKDKKTDDNKNSVSVTVISDGQTGPGNKPRVSAGSYQYLADNQQQPVNHHPNIGRAYVNDVAAKHATTPYENDMDMRPLPSKPKDSAGYYNPAFRNSSTDDQKPHEYSTINI